jgi:PAS domain S-box-containing protein
MGFSMYSQEEQDKILEAVEKAIEEKRMFDLKAQFNRSDGQTLKVQLTGFPVEVGGEVVQVKGMIRDITQEEADKLSIEREQNFSRQLIERMQEGVLILSPKGKVVSINPAFSRMTGYASEEIIGQEGTCPYWPEEEYETLREAERILKQNGEGDFELTLKRKSGERFPVICKASSIYNEDNEVELHFANITDVSSIKEAQDKIEQSNRFQQVIFDAIPAYVLVKDKSFQVVKANRRFIDMYPNEVKSHLMASTSLEMYTTTDQANFLREDRKALAEGFSEVEEEITFPNGKKKTLLTRKVRFYGQQKEPYILVLATDITELKTLQKEKERLQQKTQDQNSRLRNFARIVSHNLRTHVGGIGSLLNMVQKNKPEIFEQQEFQLLCKASQNLQQTITDLTQVVQAELDAEPLQRGNLYKCVEKNIEAVKPQAEEQKVKILNEVAQDIYVQVIPAYLDSIIINFLTNAIKYADEEKPSRWVRLTATLDENFVRFECSDNGMGIDLEKNRDRIFGMYQTFHQHEDSRGVGLYMTKTQVESMGGKIDVKSQVGKGTSFTASFLLDK